MFENILNEAFKGNYSWFILLTNIAQLVVGIIACVFAIKTYINTKKK